MADLTTTQLKLSTTPTAGVSGEQSPYYRRLLSAGYKGFLQGTVGGGTLYGVIGAGIGLTVALPLMLALGPATAGGIAALSLIPAMGGLGLYKGAGTFGNIGSLAAITAESAEMSEKRRYLLDRYYDLPETPEFDDEAAQIRELLAKQHESKAPPHMFHWRTVAIGAALGAGIALLLMLTPAGAAIASSGAHFLFGHALGIKALAGTSLTVGGIAASTVVGSALGALTGGMIGLDRYYVRNWLDRSANLMHDTKSIEDQIRERQQEIEKLGAGSNEIKTASVTEIKQYLPPAPPGHDEALKINIAEPGQPLRETAETAPQAAAPARRELPITPGQIAGLSEAPLATVAAAQSRNEGRVSLERALQTPAI